MNVSQGSKLLYNFQKLLMNLDFKTHKNILESNLVYLKNTSDLMQP